MKSFPRHAMTALAVASLALVATSCKPGDKDKDAAKTSEATEAAKPGDALKIPGLATEKQQASYMIGLDIAKTLETVKDDIDLATINKAMKTALEGGKPLMDEAQTAQVREAFAAKIQAKRIAEMMAAAKKNLTEGQTFLAANGKKPEVKTTASGLQYQVITEGKGAKPVATDNVRVHYKGTLLNGTEFDSSYTRGEPAEFMLQQVVPGWQEGIALMPVGSKYKFWIPSKLGYGEQGTPGGPIGPNATLVFEVELLDIAKGGAGQAQGPGAPQAGGDHAAH